MKQFRKQLIKELQKPSITVKWAFASSFFIFFIFTIFAVITYNSSVSLLVEKERDTIEKTVKEVNEKLAKSNENLTVSQVYKQLKTPSVDKNQLENKKLMLEVSLLEMNSMLSELGQPELFLTIYDNQGVLIFETQKEYTELLRKKNQLAEIRTIDGKTGFFLIESVQSKETGEKIGYIQAFYDLSSFYAIKNRLLTTLVILEIVSLILSSILGVWLSSYFLKPLKVLRDTMETIRKDPQSTIHAPNIDSNDELADLAEIFNEMLDRMRRYIEQQEQFVEDVSHELRTPVAIIEGHLNLLNRWGKEDPEILEESLEASLQEISRMKNLIQEMLDLSRAEQVDIQYSHESSQAKQVVYQVVNNFKLLYPDFTITLDDDLMNDLTIGIYRNHFEQLLIIILDNAIKYSTIRQEIHVSISKTRNEFEIAIQDFGEGIDSEDLNKIFHRFYRVDKARSRNKGGNGLGLSIAKKLVENYGGKINAESVIHQGTIFRINLPII